MITTSMLPKLSAERNRLIRKITWDDDHRGLDLAQALDLDIRPLKRGLMNIGILGYDTAARSITDLGPSEKKIVYGASGPSVSDILFSLSANRACCVDLTPVRIDKLQAALEAWKGMPIRRFWLKYNDNYWHSGYNGMADIELKIISELKTMGVSRLNKNGSPNILFSQEGEREVGIRFKWKDYLSQQRRDYFIVFTEADITDPSTYSEYFNRWLGGGISAYLQKGSWRAFSKADNYLAYILGFVNTGGLFISDDVIFTGDHYPWVADNFLDSLGMAKFSKPLLSREMQRWEQLLIKNSEDYGYGWKLNIKQKIN